MAKGKKTIQIGLRIDEDQLKKIEEIAEVEKIDKMSWIRRAIADSLTDFDTEMEDVAVEDYIKCRIDENELKGITGMTKIPEDLKKARKEVINKLVKKK